MNKRSARPPARRRPPPADLGCPSDVGSGKPGRTRLAPADGGVALETAWLVTIPVSSRVYLVGAASVLALGVAVSLLWLVSGIPPLALNNLDGRARGVIAVIPVAAVSVALTGFAAARAIRMRRRIPPQWHLLPAISGFDDRLHVERYRGRCPQCGGPLKFYNKPTRWREEPGEGGPHTVVAERRLAAECRREASHWWEISRTA